jgi:hypothetical protein
MDYGIMEDPDNFKIEDLIDMLDEAEAKSLAMRLQIATGLVMLVLALLASSYTSFVFMRVTGNQDIAVGSAILILVWSIVLFWNWTNEEM